MTDHLSALDHDAMFTSCIRIHDRHQDGSHMRPSGSKDPMLHWAYRLAAHYLGQPGIAIAGAEDDIGIEVWINKNFWKSNPHAFDHIMHFTRSNQLDYSIDEDECKKCEGRATCLRNDQQ